MGNYTMKRLVRISAVMICMSAVHAACLSGKSAEDMLEIVSLTCDYSCGKVMTDNPAPQFGWEFAPGSSHSQSAYRIMAATSEACLDKGIADMWDSGKVISSDSQHVKYSGKRIASRQTLYWKVMVWDETGAPVHWSDVSEFTSGLLYSTDWKAGWIGQMEDPFPGMPVTFPAPYFRKEFQVRKPLRKATAYISGLGFYEMRMNGEKVGEQELVPAVSEYDSRSLDNMLYYFDDESTRRVYYNVFDVSDQLRRGRNAVGVILGNGWYNQRDRTVEGYMWYRTPRMICQIEIEYKDGTRDTIVSDTSWKVSSGPLLHDGIFTGEIYDSRLDLGGWDKAGYDDSSWKSAAAVISPEGKLQLQSAPYDRIMCTVSPESFEKADDSTWLYTFPEMISGWVRLDVSGKEGDRVTMHFIGEEGDDFGQTDTYILKGERREVWTPRFTWHAFRSVKVISEDLDLTDKSLSACEVYTDVGQTGYFHCSNPLFNKIAEAYIRTQKNNFHGSVSSDCPHRERLAYTGDAQVAAESAMYLFDMKLFYRKWFDDMSDARNHKSGYVPHTAPFGGGGGGPAWGSAYVIMPWLYYCHYGDRSVLERHYSGMRQWVEYLGTRVDSRGVVVREEPGGWCLGEWCVPGDLEIPAELVNTAYYYHVADIMGKVASVLGNVSDERFFKDLASSVKSCFNAAFFDDGKGCYWEGRQGADVFPLAFGLVPEGREDDVLSDLLTNLGMSGYHFDTGILATPLLLDVLSEAGYGDIAYRLMDQRDRPGFGYLMDTDSTCLWETWEGDASHCHPMFGSVVKWFFSFISGIRYDTERPGMRTLVIEPHPVGDLSYSSASCRTLYGEVSSSWRIADDDFILDVTVPVNSDAEIILPDGSRHTVHSGEWTFTVPLQALEIR